MLELIFFILAVMIFGKIFLFAIKAAWSISKIIVSIVLMPLFLIGLVLTGLLWLAMPILLIIGIVSMVTLRK